MEKESKKDNIFEGLLFLLPPALIRREHLTRRDVRAIKGSLSVRLGLVSFFTAALLFIFNLLLLISMGIRTNWHQAEVYGFWSVFGQLTGAISAFLVMALQVISHLAKKPKLSVILSRIGIDLLYAGAALEFMLMIYTDAKMGYTANVEALSPGFLLVAILVLSQPAFWVDGIALNLWASITVFAISYACHVKYNMGGITYYGILCIGLPFAAYLVTAVLFFAEANHYVQKKQNERLYDSAMYDDLTKCKNRRALKSFIGENAKRWEGKETNLLLIIFDIDNFKEYNDQFSHPGGDHCLRVIADSVRKAFPSPDLDFYRYGGEEFLLFFELRDPEDAASIMESVRLAVRDAKLTAPEGAPEKVVTISLGGTLIKTLGTFSFDNLLEKVDGYLYAAKRNGKDLSCLDGEFCKKQAAQTPLAN